MLVLAGPGNNGGDARIVAERLKEQFFRVTWRKRPAAAGALGAGGGRPVRHRPGATCRRQHAALIEYANRQSCPVLALDMPSGLEADSGRVLGCAVRASHTITFLALKPGLLTLDGPDHGGDHRRVGPGRAGGARGAGGWVAGPAVRHRLKARPRNFHKGMAGSLAMFGGAAGMTGAALLAGRAALKLGAGRVYVGLLEEAASLEVGAPSSCCATPTTPSARTSTRSWWVRAWASPSAPRRWCGAALASDLPCVLDADALNLIAENSDLRKACARRRGDTLLTPHPAEAARLLGCSVKCRTTALTRHRSSPATCAPTSC